MACPCRRRRPLPECLEHRPREAEQARRQGLHHHGADVEEALEEVYDDRLVLPLKVGEQILGKVRQGDLVLEGELEKSEGRGGVGLGCQQEAHGLLDHAGIDLEGFSAVDDAHANEQHREEPLVHGAAEVHDLLEEVPGPGLHGLHVLAEHEDVLLDLILNELNVLVFGRGIEEDAVKLGDLIVADPLRTSLRVQLLLGSL